MITSLNKGVLWVRWRFWLFEISVVLFKTEIVYFSKVRSGALSSLGELFYSCGQLFGHCTLIKIKITFLIKRNFLRARSTTFLLKFGWLFQDLGGHFKDNDFDYREVFLRLGTQLFKRSRLDELFIFSILVTFWRSR